MALVKCRDCGGEMSYFAKACPHCAADYTRALGAFEQRLTKCRDCEGAMSYFANACPKCGAHYTRALGTYHRGLTYSGVMVAVIGGWLYEDRGGNFGSYFQMYMARDLPKLLFVVSALLLAWGIFFGLVRRTLTSGEREYAADDDSSNILP